MKRKRLKHVADTLCHMFCGWRLMNCYTEMADLGSGTLVIDAITGGCMFEGAKISSLSIARELEYWMKEDLEKNNIPLDSVKVARLEAVLQFSDIDRGERAKSEQFFDAEGKHVKTREMHRCAIHCSSVVETRSLLAESFMKGFDGFLFEPFHYSYN